MLTEKKKVGILGYRGKMGSALVEVLKNGYVLRLGGRSAENGNDRDTGELNAIQYMRVDIRNDHQLREFMVGLDAVINCAPASWIYSPTVAKAAEENNVIYIDPFGSEELLKQEKLEGRKWILGAGSFPGFSGVFPKYIAEITQLEAIDRMDMVSFMDDENSVGAVTDLILSSVKGFGRGNACYIEGKVKPCSGDRRHYPGFEDNLNAGDYMNEETKAVAEELNVREAHWINMRSDSSRENDLRVQKITMTYMKNRDLDELNSLVNQITDRDSNEYRDNEYGSKESSDGRCQIGCYMEGKTSAGYVSVASKISMEESTQLNVLMLKQALIQALEDPENVGICRAMDYVNAEGTMTKVFKNKGLKDFFCNVIPVDDVADDEEKSDYGIEGEI